MSSFSGLLRPLVEHVFLIDQVGTPLVHLARSPAEIVPNVPVSESSLVTQLIDASIEPRERPARDVLNLHVAFGSGKYTRLFVLYRGRESTRIGRRVERAVRDLERRHGPTLKGGLGKVEAMADVNRDLGRLWGLRGPPVVSGRRGANWSDPADAPRFVSAIIVSRIDPKLR